MMMIIIIVEEKKSNDEVIRSPPQSKKKVIWVHKGAVQAPHRYAAASNIPGLAGLVC